VKTLQTPFNDQPLPSGIITFLFSDIQGSTPLWEQNPEGMRASLAQHNAILHEAITANGGLVFKTVGDEFCVVFVDPVAAVTAALEGQRGLATAEWGSTESGHFPFVEEASLFFDTVRDWFRRTT